MPFSVSVQPHPQYGGIETINHSRFTIWVHDDTVRLDGLKYR